MRRKSSRDRCREFRRVAVCSQAAGYSTGRPATPHASSVSSRARTTYTPAVTTLIPDRLGSSRASSSSRKRMCRSRVSSTIGRHTA